MSQLHPNEDDDAFASNHTHAGWNKAVRRCMKLRALLYKIREGQTLLSSELRAEIDAMLEKNFYAESEEFPPPGWDKLT